ncbi:TonB-dependent receptor plug [Hymenobacter roseosalivarius DSM 11622]|uniref:TonB-dependent receptor plug n=1 Tax=Hymenobacter roseosalivarius DSM 11622 TaxID=645990 RepID=A0A1W1V1R1_9BACT|nr:TonB-dependent receptor [Hymenobacter roseosalivarius]SMB87230.1 TonB-dependent receptor plug [Hymenobacter roseosalivarius DSM 11622]
MKKPVPKLRWLAIPALLCSLPLTVAAEASAAASVRAALPYAVLQAADITISGRVTDEKGEGLPGVNVVVKGTTNGTQTDVDGRYTITAPDNATLVISYVGYTPRELAVGGRTTIDVPLAPDAQSLNEVVIVGYLTQNRQDVTGSVASVSAEDIRRAPVATVTEAIQGRLPGVTVTSSGQPGQASNVNVRGIGTLGGTSSGPLYIVDGLWTDNVRDFNPADAESVQVLKDAASLAAYGSRGANGVVIITTRKGRAGTPAITFNGYTGVQNIAKRYDLMGAQEWAEVNNLAYENAGLRRQPASNQLTGTDTDWQDELFQTGRIQDYNLGFSGGNESSNFLISAGYFNQKGTIIGPKFERYSLRLNSGFNRGRLRVGQNALLTRADQVRVNGLPFIDVVRLPPTLPVLDPANPGGFAFGNSNNSTFGTNPIASQDLLRSTGLSYRLQGNIYGEVSIFDFLRYRLNLATELHNFRDEDRRKFGQQRQNAPLDPSFLYQGRGSELFLMAENTLTFDQSFGNNNVTAVVGYSEQKNTFEISRATNRGYGTGPTYYWSLDAGSQNPAVSGGTDTWTKRSYFAQVTYDYNQRYLLTAAYRRDGSSRFSPENLYGDFYAASAGWRVSEEAFFDGITAISNLKVRGSYGQLGNDGLPGNYLYQGFINPNVNYPFGTAQTVLNGNSQTQLASTGIKWETRATTNIGFDLGLLEDRFTFSADYYISRTKDALVNPDPAFFLGNQGINPFVNLGRIENRGFEFIASYNENRSKFRYGVQANMSTLKNKVLELTDVPGQVFNAGPEGGITRTEVGYPVGSFYLYQFDGIFQTGDNIANSAQPNAKPGDVRYKDLNGDGRISEDDRAHSGSPFPKLQYGLNLTSGYGEFDLAVFFQGIAGNDVWNGTRFWTDRLDENSAYRSDLNPWTTTNPSTTTPRPVKEGESARNNSRIASTRWLESGSYLRMKNVQLGYTLPKGMLERVKGVGSVRVYLTGQNVFTITDYTGYDPETIGGVTGGVLTRGLDEGSYPNVRTFTAGIQLGF